MEARNFYFTVHSASDLKDVRLLGEMKVYAKVTIAGKSKYTKVDLVNKTNPVWNATFRFFVPEIHIDNIRVKIEFFCQRSFSDDKYVGHLNLSIKPLGNKGAKYSFTVDRNDNSSGNFGTANFSHILGDKVIVEQDTSPPPSSSSSLEDYILMLEMIKTGVEIVSEVVKF
ncbi:putative cytochrome 93A1-like [Capsicum annuum]|uniref:protein SRC2 homolog n=1 Tax=Capsicum annuum TaxID=4072 RepID=UPI0007BFA5BB|nr:protein SRC2 homolog [Capsicum annuum]KAF3665205.1 putative cytochrome 93A1-like [Capsicum annuum]KAF3675697.1 putative cytochrome 93A1-like [Capsicum annuum]